MAKLLRFLSFTLLLGSFPACLSYHEVQYEGIQDVEVLGISTTGIKAKLMIKIRNPNHYKITILGGSFDIQSEGLALGTFKLSERSEIPKKSTTLVPLLIDAQLKSLFSPETLKLLAHIQKNKIPISITGHLTAKAYLVRKKVPFELSEVISL